jgi:general secretion pathway protein H
VAVVTSVGWASLFCPRGQYPRGQNSLPTLRRISPRGLHAQRSSGFTLIEILVTLVVMGIALGMVMVQLMPDPRSDLRVETERLALLLENAGLEARASGRSWAWSGEVQGYRFWRKNDYGEWADSGDGVLRPRTFPLDMHLRSVSVDDRPIKLGEYVVLSAASFPTPFRIVLGNAAYSASVVGKSTGEVSAQLDDSPNDATR